MQWMLTYDDCDASEVLTLYLTVAFYACVANQWGVIKQSGPVRWPVQVDPSLIL